jgi:hypothetical protein
MYTVMAIANYEDRFVIPTGHREDAEDMPTNAALRLLLRQWLLPVRRPGAQEAPDPDGGVLMRLTLRVLSALLRYPDAAVQDMAAQNCGGTARRGWPAEPRAARRAPAAAR